jgi:multidrug efflux pump subunit AcrA (membrane-fusion protein)
LHGLTPYDLVKDKEARLAFRRFAGENPGVWDYTAAKIPPLSKDQEAEKKAKDAEKKKKKKQAAKDRKKAQQQQEQVRSYLFLFVFVLVSSNVLNFGGSQAEQEQRQSAEADRQKALALRQVHAQVAHERDSKLMTMSEREKRALAAERRIAAMSGSADICAWCGKQLVTVPFERLNFKYCTTACVVSHKNQLEGKQ